MLNDAEEETKQPADKAEEKPRRTTKRATKTEPTSEETTRPKAAQGAAVSPANPATQRAEDLLDRFGSRVSQLLSEPADGRSKGTIEDAGRRAGRVASEVSLQARRMTARAREEVEDIWAEAQALRRRNPS